MYLTLNYESTIAILFNIFKLYYKIYIIYRNYFIKSIETILYNLYKLYYIIYRDYMIEFILY